MRTLYLDCGMGAAGDMLTAALLELLPDREGFLKELNGLGIPGVEVAQEPCVKCGIRGTHVTVRVNGVDEAELLHEQEHHHPHDEEEHKHHHHHDEEEHEHHHHDHEHEHEHHHEHEHEHEHHDHEHHGHEHAHHHSSVRDIGAVIDALPVSEKVRGDIHAVYGLIAEAESHAHGVPVTEIHFHEVGTMDAVADVTAVCLLMERLGVEQVVVSPVHVGSGHVHCAHGILPVPAPATAFILKGAPIYGGKVKGELCTPTGAALLKHFAARFGDMPVMQVEAIGYGMGRKDFEMANCLRAMLGQTQEGGGEVAELTCNLDDMTPEALGFAQERLLEAGALDVWTVAAGMKKNRPGVVLSVLCRPEDREKMAGLLFLHTTTLGVREQLCRRYTLERSVVTEDTAYGPVRRKVAQGYGVTREKVEYEDAARVAREQGVSLAQAEALLRG